MLSSLCSVYAYDKGNGIEVLMGYDTEDDKIYMISSEVAIRGYQHHHKVVNDLVTYPYAPWWFVPSYESDRDLWDAVVLQRDKDFLPYLDNVKLDRVGQVLGAYSAYKGEVVDALRKLGVKNSDIEELLERI